jgi:flagellar L-ring protein precursor FlgH
MMASLCNNRSRVSSCAAVAAAAILALNSAATAGDPLIDLETGASLVTNQKARQIGDVVTILIVEQSSASSTNKTDANNRSEVGGGPGLGFLDFLGEWELDVENKYKGDGKTSRTGNLRAEISARIVEILHNGDYRLEGTRMVAINGERQLIEIAGTCRPQDIRNDNTILSTYISDAQIAYSGSGTVYDAAEPGVITKIVNWLF